MKVHLKAIKGLLHLSNISSQDSKLQVNLVKSVNQGFINHIQASVHSVKPFVHLRSDLTEHLFYYSNLLQNYLLRGWTALFEKGNNVHGSTQNVPTKDNILEGISFCEFSEGVCNLDSAASDNLHLMAQLWIVETD